jgi:uncharacterized protein (DUF1330 family)
MSFYAVVGFTITDRSWVREYVRNVKHIVASHDGRYLIRSGDIEAVEGAEKPELLVVLEFPDRDSAYAFYNDPAYQPYRDARIAGTTSTFYMVPGDEPVQPS